MTGMDGTVRNGRRDVVGGAAAVGYRILCGEFVCVAFQEEIVMMARYSSEEAQMDAALKASLTMLKTAFFLLLSALVTLIWGITIFLSSVVTFGVGVLSLLLWGINVWRSSMRLLLGVIQSLPEMQGFAAGK